MRRRAALAAICATATLAPAASAQTHVGRNIEGGLHWSVSAPEGAAWTLLCRFPPVTYFRTNYDRESWINQLVDSGRGSSRGRLPLDTGHCEVTKTGGAGPVAVAVGRAGKVSTAVVRDAGQSATAGLF